MTPSELFCRIINKGNARIKLLGDSITHGRGGTGFKQDGEPIVEDFRRNPNGNCWAKQFSELMAARYGAVVVNNACTGTKIEFVIEHFDTLVDKEDDLVICAIGTNNRHQLKSEVERLTREEMADRFYSNILTLHSKFKSIGIPVIFVANIPATAENEAGKSHLWRILHMKDICELYKLASIESNFPLIPLYDRMNEYLSRTKIPLEQLLPDGLHPSDEGHAVMLELMLDELGQK